MMKRYKICILTVALLAFPVLGTSISAKADDVKVDNKMVSFERPKGVEAVFDLNNLSTSGETQSVTDEKGNVTNFTVTTDTNPRARIANGTHTVRAGGLGWYVSFKIRTSSNNITSAYGLNYVITPASVTSASLRRNSNKQATASFQFQTHIWNVVSWTGWVKARIVNNSLVVITN